MILGKDLLRLSWKLSLLGPELLELDLPPLVLPCLSPPSPALPSLPHPTSCSGGGAGITNPTLLILSPAISLLALTPRHQSACFYLKDLKESSPRSALSQAALALTGLIFAFNQGTLSLWVHKLSAEKNPN